MKRVLLGALAFLAFSLTEARAQYVIKKHKVASSGTISGVVLGPDDRPAPHAAITYQSSSGNAPHAVHADSRGRFTITRLDTDNYDLRATSNGVFSEWQKNFQVTSGRTSEITLHLIYAREMPKSSKKSTKKN